MKTAPSALGTSFAIALIFGAVWMPSMPDSSNSTVQTEIKSP